MVNLGLVADFKIQFFQWDGATVHMKEPRGLLGQSDLNKCEMRKVVMHNVYPASRQKDTEIMFKIFNSTYVKAYLKQVANNVNQLNAEERAQLLILLEDFEDLFDGNLEDWATEPVNLDLKLGYKPFNSGYYPVHRINKEHFRKEIKRIVEIGMLNLEQQSQYSTPVFIIPNKEGNGRFVTDYLRLNHKLVRNPYTLPIIGDTMQKLEGFQYATALDINMRY